ncbi:magnesium transporter [Shimia haliotis]|uniref:Magnesium transporter n=1 Tax=Shimia haliotis TaxID=1280847 RepID=A0A1I4CVZ5_9RHOB|nr:magnesium transporter [Shimia haliotis]SFK85422.1 magnesium transporter [Shimia haliotis]
MGTFIWQDEREEAGRVANKATLRRIDELVMAGDRAAVLAATADWAPADTLACLLQLRPARARLVFDWLPDSLGLKVLSELDSDLHAVLYSPQSEATFSNIIGMMDVDEAVDTLLELPRAFAAKVFAGLPDAERIATVLQARDDSAATVMRLGVLMAPVNWTVGQLTQDIRARSQEIGKIDMMFVVDEARKPLGFLRFRDVLQAPDDVSLSEMVNADLEIVSADTDREDVLKLAREKGVHAIGVVDALGKLVGGISPRELGDILRDEVEEDMLVMGSVSPATTQFDGPLTILKRRLPWLVGGLCGASFAAVVIGSYEEALAQAAVLASFIPVVMATAGNAGIQASTVSVQTLTSGTNWRGDFGARMMRECLGAVANGLSIGAITAILVMILSLALPLSEPHMLALTAFLALTLVTTIAGTLGALIPFLLRALGLDPAVATGIFITTTNDVFGVLIFFLVASALYL